MEVETDKATVVYEAEDDGTLEAILVSEGESAAVGQPIARLAGDGAEAATGRGAASRTARLRPARARMRRRSRAGPRSSSASRSTTSPGPARAEGSRARTFSVRRATAPVRPAGRCPRGRHHRRADADTGDDRAPHGAVGCGDPDLHRLRRRRCVGGRRASPRRARGVASTPLAQRLRREGRRTRSARVSSLQRVVRRRQDRVLLARQRRGRRCGGRRAAGSRRRRRRPEEPRRDRGRDAAARGRRAQPFAPAEELRGGTFTVSNLGMFGVRSFTAIVDPRRRRFWPSARYDARRSRTMRGRSSSAT